MTKAFDVGKLQPGDEVGIERCPDGAWEPWTVTRVVAVHEDLIELEGDEWYKLDGTHLSRVVKLRLAAPTDEGRILSLRETAGADLYGLARQADEMDLPTLRRLKAWIDAKGWAAACAS